MGTGMDSIIVTVTLHKSPPKLGNDSVKNAARIVWDNKSKAHGQVGLQLGLVTVSSHA